MQRTLKRELKELEVVEMEAIINPTLGVGLNDNLLFFELVFGVRSYERFP